MKHLLRTKRKKSLESPLQHISGRPPNTVAGPPDQRAELGPGIPTQHTWHRMDLDRELLAPGAWNSGIAISTGPSHGDQRTTKGNSNTGGGVAVRVEASKVAKRARKGTLLVGAEGDTERFGPLKVVLGAIPALCANRVESIAVGNKVENLFSSVTALEEDFNSRPDDVAEQRRRDELIRKLNVIEGQLRLLSEGSGSRWPTDRVQDGDEDIFTVLLEDAQEVIFHYQMERRMATGDQGFEPIDPAEAAVLNNFRYAQQAEYRHGNRNGCLKGTRRAVLDEIEFWIRDFDKPSIYWLNGLAGTGKSTIAQTIAERAFASGRLGASFFCSRDFEDRRNLQLIFPTISVQLARRYTEFRSIVVPLVQSDPEIAHESLYGQMKKLIVQPLVKSAISTVIVIDALDECKDEEPASAILSVLGQFVIETPKVKFFITGRPEPRIREGFRLPLLAKAADVFVLHEVDSSLVDGDIRLLFRHAFSEPKDRRRGLDGWPTQEQVDLLCERAAGLFVHAMATVRFIGQKNNSPKKQLDRLLQSQGSGALEGKTKLKANATLDSLYMSILQEAFGDDDPENDSRVRSVLGAVVLAVNPLSPSTIATLLGFELEEVFPLLSSAHSLLVLQEDINCPVRPFHKSFPEFIVDPARCDNSRFRVCPPDQHTEILAGCLEIMDRKLERNMCKLPGGVANSEVVDLRERTEEHIGRALQYACRSWHKHLVGPIPPQIAPVLRRFFEQKFLFWLEVLSVLGAAREAVDALEVAEKCKWPDMLQAPSFVRDCLRFVIAFFEVISTSAPHIYHSALPLSPRTSTIHELYKQNACPFARVVRGLPTSWEPVVATVYINDFGGEAVWSPCNRFIAVSNFGSVEILDAVTLDRLNAFNYPPGSDTRQLSFSPDARFLLLFDGGDLASWDLQTGGPLGTISPGLGRLFAKAFSFAYSIDGKTVAVAYEIWSDNDDNDDYDTFIATYDLFSRTYIRSYQVSEGRIITPIWTHNECVRFATLKSRSVTIWEVGFVSTHAPAEVQALPTPEEILHGERFLFLPALSRLAFTLEDTVMVWDAKVSKLLLKSWPTQASHPIWSPNPTHSSTRSSFSSDGRFFTCMTAAGEVYVWKESPAGYTPHQKLAFAISADSPGPRLSPNGESIIMSLHPKVHSWSTKDEILSPPSVPTGDSDRRDPILGFSPGEKFAAFGRRGSTTITILDLRSGDLRLVVDMGIRVDCLRMGGSAVVVVGEGKIVTWDLPGGNGASNTRTNVSNSVRTTTLDRSPPSRYFHKPISISISPDLSHVVVEGYSSVPGDTGLDTYETSTGRCLASTRTTSRIMPRLTPDGREVWGLNSYSSTEEQWEITWHSEPDNYKVTGDGWVLSGTKKRLLWLPHRWRSNRRYREWSGRFLGLLHGELSEVVILEFLE